MQIYSLTDAECATSQWETICLQAEKKEILNRTAASASLSSPSVRVRAQWGRRLLQLMSQLAGRERVRNLREPSGDSGLSACSSILCRSKCAVTIQQSIDSHKAAPLLRKEKKIQTTNFPRPSIIQPSSSQN